MAASMGSEGGAREDSCLTEGKATRVTAARMERAQHGGSLRGRVRGGGDACHGGRLHGRVNVRCVPWREVRRVHVECGVCVQWGLVAAAAHARARSARVPPSPWRWSARSGSAPSRATCVAKRSETATWAASGWESRRFFCAGPRRQASPPEYVEQPQASGGNLKSPHCPDLAPPRRPVLTMLRLPQLHPTELRIDVAADAAAAATAAATIVAHCARRRVRRVVTVREPLWVRRDGEGGGARERDAQGDSDVRCADGPMRGGARELQRALWWP